MPPSFLIVDDDPAFAAAASQVLQRQGFDVRRHMNTRGALDDLLHHPGTRGVFLDVRVKGESGLDLLERMRCEGIAVPVIIVTAHLSGPVLAAARRYGVLDVLSKPVGQRELSAAAQALLSARAAANS